MENKSASQNEKCKNTFLGEQKISSFFPWEWPSNPEKIRVLESGKRYYHFRGGYRNKEKGIAVKANFSHPHQRNILSNTGWYRTKFFKKCIKKCGNWIQYPPPPPENPHFFKSVDSRLTPHHSVEKFHTFYLFFFEGFPYS